MEEYTVSEVQDPGVEQLMIICISGFASSTIPYIVDSWQPWPSLHSCIISYAFASCTNVNNIQVSPYHLGCFVMFDLKVGSIIGSIVIGFKSHDFRANGFMIGGGANDAFQLGE